MLSISAAPPVPYVRVPLGAKVTIDGRIGKAEWAGAARQSARGAILLAKRSQSRLLIGVKLPRSEKRYVDLYVADADGRVRNYHASLRQGERILPAQWTDEHPKFTWGKSSDWAASLAPRALVADGPTGVLFEGYELAIAVAHLGRCPFRVRAEVRDFFGQGQDWVFPAASTRSNVDSWAWLRVPCKG